MSMRRRKGGTVPEVGADTGSGLGSSPGGVPDRDYGPHGGLLDTAEPYAGQGVRVPEESMFGAQSRDGFAPTPQGMIGRSVQMNLGAQTYALREQNREYLIELGTIVGHEGDDFQNPYVWTATGVLVYPSELSSELAPGIGGVRLGQTPEEVALNVAHSANIMQV